MENFTPTPVELRQKTFPMQYLRVRWYWHVFWM